MKLLLIKDWCLFVIFIILVSKGLYSFRFYDLACLCLISSTLHLLWKNIKK